MAEGSQRIERTSRLAERVRAAREAKGEAIEAVSRETGVPLRYLKMFEEGRYPMVSDPAYLAPFLRRYAAHLGLDAGQALRDFIGETEPETAARRAGKLPPLEGILEFDGNRPRELSTAGFTQGDPKSRPQRGRRTGYVLAMLVAAAVAAGGYLGVTRGGSVENALAVARAAIERGTAIASKKPAPQVADPPKLPVAPAAPSPRPAPVAAAKPTVAVLPEAMPSPTPPRASQSLPAPAMPEGLSPPYELRLTATSRSAWVSVSIDGGPRRDLELHPGQSVNWVAQRGYVLTVDDAGAVWAVLNGTVLGALGPDLQVRRNLVIPSTASSSAQPG